MVMAQPIEIRYDPSFVEEAVFLELSAREAAGDRREVLAFHAQRSAIYEAEGLREQRDAAFQQLAARYFRELGFAELFLKRLEEVPLVAAHVHAVMVRRVFCRRDERVELYVLPGSEAHRHAGGPATLLIDLQAVGCRDRQRLIAWLRHELMHVSDMLDPVFAYAPHRELGGECELEDDLTRERFRLLWDLFVEGRMRRRGWPVAVEGSVRRREFERIALPWEPERRNMVWRTLGSREHWTQRELLELAQDERLTRMLGQGGVRCPLCHFPTREGMRDWSHERAALAEAIRADYPAWAPSHGACLQCVELYRSRLQPA
jgi:hypothetical protein